ncbi:MULTISPECIES: hypothetical protein [Pseudomonas]|uniref:hypothetical protein n=1 Tax=Pseudomonas TaxID=286 RepID=UPI000BB5E6C6|nr:MULTISPECIES: hypothetical protein [Pseudomonas]MBC8879937.1 hypothetical protein [Pseudomonas cerasi]MCK9691590.1 HEPN domain-containing protein [Pseudomonas syringae pv. syringae]MCK9702541.1 HEPN domain-containing protein [Pseudomonas syringae pv. syringae]MCK9758217.1 HEPN domain-containing protein [Pseudomonas syringae pv. syringae]MCK9773872.1 HEPN domain-containing protein [Pseudomonas syringae pv. syringae]
MTSTSKLLPAGRQDFAKDPFGYSALGPMKWGHACMVAGVNNHSSALSPSDILKNPILWLTQAQAMSDAAFAVLSTEQSFQNMPAPVRGICESQYCAIVLMLVGYSLEISLKAMLIVQKGITGYTEIENKIRHHRLEDLASFIPELTKKDKAILRGLTHFVSWAGRYPDPGSGREDNIEQIFDLGEKHQVTGHDLFKLAAHIMQHTKNVVEQN